MAATSASKNGGVALIAGSLALVFYSILFAALLPIGKTPQDFVNMVSNPHWTWLAALALTGVLLLMAGFVAVYSRMRSTAGKIGTIGFSLLEVAFFLQACRITWEIFLYPIIASHTETAFLFNDSIIIRNPAVLGFYAISGAAILAGTLLFCLALVRSTVFPKSAAILVFVGSLVYAVGPTVSIYLAIAGICTLAVGCILLARRLMRLPN